MNIANLLTPLQMGILGMVADKSMSQAEIAAALNRSPNTIATHIQRIRGKLGARNTLELIKLYWLWRAPGEREYRSWGEHGAV